MLHSASSSSLPVFLLAFAPGLAACAPSPAPSDPEVESNDSEVNASSGGSPNLFVRVEGDPTSKAGQAAQKIFAAMAAATETSESGATVRRSAMGSATCAHRPGFTQCVLGPFGHVGSR